MSGGPPGRDPGVFTRPGAASIRAAALWDAVYELAIGQATGISVGGAQGLVDQGIAAHEAKEDAHPVYVTVPEGDLRWGASSGLAPHTHEDTESGGTIDYLRTQWGTDHLAAANPHSQYLRTPAVQALIDAAITTLKAEPDPFPVYLRQAEADLLYLPVTYTPPAPDLSGYYTKVQSDARYEPIDTMYTKAESDGRYLQPATAASTYVPLVGGSVLTGLLGPTTTNARDLGTTTLRWRKTWTVDADVLTGLVVASKAVALDPLAGNTLAWNAAGFYSSSPTKAQYDALVARVAALEAQMGTGVNGHYHLMSTWRQVGKPILPVTQREEEEALAR